MRLFRFLTVEQLQDSEEDIENLKTLSKRQRTAVYNFLTARIYRLNKDTLRESAIWMREDLLKATRTEKNAIPFDRQSILKKPADFLPFVYHDEKKA